MVTQFVPVYRVNLHITVKIFMLACVFKDMVVL